jgi:hypothetical protein
LYFDVYSTGGELLFRYKQLLETCGSVLDIHPFTDSISILFSSRTATLYCDLPSKDPKNDMFDWVSNYPYSDKKRNQIIASRNLYENQLLVDKLLNLFNINDYPPKQNNLLVQKIFDSNLGQTLKYCLVLLGLI